MLDEELCLPLSEDIPFDVGAILGESLGTPYHEIRRLLLNAIDNVLIFGQGPVGLGTTLVCKFFNDQVIVMEINDHRLRIAKDIGADYTLNPRALGLFQEPYTEDGADGCNFHRLI